MSRSLGSADLRSVENVRAENCGLLLERIEALELVRVTADFDDSVQSTGRHAEGAAVRFDKQKKGRRSYYPLFCTVVQTGKILDVHHRPGNVQDSSGANAFVGRCFEATRAACPGARGSGSLTAADSQHVPGDVLHMRGGSRELTEHTTIRVLEVRV